MASVGTLAQEEAPRLVPDDVYRSRTVSQPELGSRSRSDSFPTQPQVPAVVLAASGHPTSLTLLPGISQQGDVPVSTPSKHPLATVNASSVQNTHPGTPNNAVSYYSTTRQSDCVWK